jgi:hypothetical protein
MKKFTFLTLLTLTFALAFAAQTPPPESGPTANTDPDAAEIVSSDIELFWRAFDKAKPENDLIVFRDEYLKKGSVGLEEFRRLRIGNSCNLVAAIESHPKYYASLRKSTAKVDSFKPQIRASFHRLKEIYPEAVFPNVYFLIGRMTSAGTLTDKGLLIGLDMFGRTEDFPVEEMNDWYKAVIASIDRVPFVVAHELIHYQQKHPNDKHTLLSRSIGEGAADFIGEIISGSSINPHLHEYGNARERELWLEFKKEMNGTDISNWLYQGNDVKDKPADLGYYIGYKIAESYYRNAPDKNRAVKDILEIKDFEKFLAASGYEQKFK